MLRAFLPPIAARWGGKMLGLQEPVGKYDRLPAYDSFDAALAASDSYGHSDIVDLVARRTEAYRQALRRDDRRTLTTPHTAQNLFVLSHLRHKGPLDVLELGGACGGTFFELDYLLPGVIRAWHIVELAATAKTGRLRFQDDRLRFFDDLEPALEGLRRRDLLMSQGALQCVANPMATLERLLKFEFAHVYLTRLEVSEDLGRPVVVRLLDKLSANGPGPVPADLVDRDTSYPATLFPPRALIAHIPASYRIAFDFAESKGRKKVLGAHTVTTRKAGLFLERVIL